MVLDRASGRREHRMVADLPELLRAAFPGPKPLLVFNNSRVRKARIFGIAGEGGAATEFLLINKPDDDSSGRTWRVLVRRAKRRRTGSRYRFTDEAGRELAAAEIIAGDRSGGEFRLLRFDRPIDEPWLERYGHVPLPPYIKRPDTAADSERYQTVYAAQTGSVAAPTAGLHFTRSLLAGLEAAGLGAAFITLHVGLGTFLPVRAGRLEDHPMHGEVYQIDAGTAAALTQARAAGRPLIAVGTTSVRTLESAWDSSGGTFRAGEGSTSIFIYPGYRFKAVEGLFTNFHTPESTLLMLVSAFAGKDLILDSYAEAVRQGYRFFSYGDAMLIL
jgi:S-adenosylmethionine:tRNA ribosyltransferase-isomerase